MVENCSGSPHIQSRQIFDLTYLLEKIWLFGRFKEYRFENRYYSYISRWQTLKTINQSMKKILWILILPLNIIYAQNSQTNIDLKASDFLNDSILITWYGDLIVGAPNSLKENKIKSILIQDCSDKYCHGTIIFINNNGLPVKEVSLNANSLYFKYSYSKNGEIEKRELHLPSDSSLIFDYNYIKEFSYLDENTLLNAVIRFSDTTKPEYNYSYLNDSTIRCQRIKNDTVQKTYYRGRSRYADIRRNDFGNNQTKVEDNIVEYSTQGDIKLPGGEEFGGSLSLRYFVNEKQLIVKVQAINKFGVILKEYELKYKRA